MNIVQENIKMKLRISSDIHWDCINPTDYTRHLNYALPIMEEDKDSVLILAGDCFRLANPKTYNTIIPILCDRFTEVLYLQGNHELYYSDIKTGDVLFKEYITQFPNFIYFNETLVSHTIQDGNDINLFVGATLWTDYDNDNPMAKRTSEQFMNDYNYIKNNGKRLIAEDLYKIHKRDLNNIKKSINKNKLPLGDALKNVIVITHHMPSMQCVNEQYKNDGLSNYSFGSDLDKMIKQYKPVVWVNGHTHCSHDINVYDTRIICNPVGYLFYSGYENSEYNSKLIIEI